MVPHAGGPQLPLYASLVQPGAAGPAVLPLERRIPADRRALALSGGRRSDPGLLRAAAGHSGRPAPLDSLFLRRVPVHPERPVERVSYRRGVFPRRARAVRLPVRKAASGLAAVPVHTRRPGRRLSVSAADAAGVCRPDALEARRDHAGGGGRLWGVRPLGPVSPDQWREPVCPPVGLPARRAVPARGGVLERSPPAGADAHRAALRRVRRPPHGPPC
jgi:hypothetical protein